MNHARIAWGLSHHKDIILTKIQDKNYQFGAIFQNFFRFKNKIMVFSTCQNGGVNFGNLGGRFPEVARNGDPPAWGLLF